MQRGPAGRYEVSTTGGERVDAFIPDPLPPAPPLDLSGPLQAQVEQAALTLGRLDSISALLPDTMLFLYSYVRKEAVLSSQIEGTQSSLSATGCSPTIAIWRRLPPARESGAMSPGSRSRED